MVIKTTTSIEHKDMFVWIMMTIALKGTGSLLVPCASSMNHCNHADRSGGNEQINKCILEL